MLKQNLNRPFKGCKCLATYNDELVQSGQAYTPSQISIVTGKRLIGRFATILKYT